MTHLQKLGTTSILKWVSLNLVENFISVSKIPVGPSGSVYIAQNSRLYGTKRGVENANNENKVRISPASSDSNYVGKVSSAAWKAAQAALLEYLHLTRNLQFLDAENMSKNSPYFLKMLLKWVEKELYLKEELDLEEVISQFLWYHPINEFEPFFESIGLKPSEYSPFLPRNLIFLSDDDLLLENYHVLCNYGVESKKIGKIYKEARDIFQYDFGVLSSKLQAYEKLGLSQSIIGKVIACSPYILIGDVNMEFVEVLETLKSIGVKLSLIEEHLKEHNSYNWSKMLRLLRFFSKMGLSEEQLGTLIRQHPGLLLEGSGDGALTLIGLLLKFGSTVDEVRLTFLQLPQIPVGRFFTNLKKCFMFFFEIDMQMDEIGKIFQSHSMFLGTCTLKKPKSILNMLNVGKRRLCEYIQENPNNLKNLVRGSKVERLLSVRDRERCLMVKAKFLEDVGLIQNPSETERAVKAFRGNGEEFQERFDCIVNAGLDRKDVSEIIRVSPKILRLKKKVIEAKIDFLVHDLGYPISFLLSYPSYLLYAMQRIKLRLSMYNWLIEQGKAEPMFALSTIITWSDKTFMERFVNQHSEGPRVWQDLKNYYVLCNYGVESKKIGKISKEARDNFQYDFGVLSSKLQAYEKLGRSQSITGKVIVYSPYMLIGDVNMECAKVLETLKSIGVEFSLIEEHSMEHNSYNWSKMLRLFSLFSKMGLSEEQLGTLIQRHPGLLLEGSGDGALTLIGLLLKFGSPLDEVRLTFLQSPKIPVGRFFTNLKQCFMFFFEIDMQMDEIGKIFRSHSMFLGTCNLKKPNSILTTLNVGKRRLCEYIQENPNNLKNLVRGSKVERLPSVRDRERSLMVKAKFLEDVGLIQNPSETERADKAFRGKGEEFQERFDCIVNAGLDRKDVSDMIRVSPKILSQKKNVIEAKIDFLVHDLGYPISTLLQFPSYLTYAMQRIKLRLLMYNWLTEQGKAEPMFALSTIITCSESTLMKHFVNQHSEGPRVWQDLKKQIYSEQ